MPVLLDTCTISEPSRKFPNSGVISYLKLVRTTDTHLSTITLAEIRKGIELLVPSKKLTKLEEWYLALLVKYDGRILTLDDEVARTWGKMAARLERQGLTMPYSDSLIAAIALTHNLDVVTRNETDFLHCGVRIVNPWR